MDNLTVNYIDTPLFEGPIFESMALVIPPSNVCAASLYDSPEERCYEFINDRWVEAAEAERIRLRQAEKNRLTELRGRLGAQL